jgi:4-hydroxy-4-methyl-2-oxoglutarate aldolase
MPEVLNDLRVFNDFERNTDLLAKFDKVVQAYSATAIFADVQYRTGVQQLADTLVTHKTSDGTAVTFVRALEQGKNR